MIDFSIITRNIESWFKQELTGYTIVRNSVENIDENVAAKNRGWLGIYKGSVSYDSARIGVVRWDATIEIIIELQCMSFQSGEDAEDRLEKSLVEVLTLLNSDPKLNNSVGETKGFEVEYEYDKNDEKSLYTQIAIIAITAGNIA